MTHYTTDFMSPVGKLHIVADERGRLVRIDFPGSRREPPASGDAIPSLRHCAEVVTQLRQYFAGTRRDFDLALAPQGTEFQRAAWRALRQIPFGRTASYLEQAQRIGNPRAVRAVGQANGRNPIPIVVPCHRVIGKDGSLSGFGGGLSTKQWLLAHEARVEALGSDRGRLPPRRRQAGASA
jgi:methylated-DNA-[protein]-cysteine S-methyltransferase